MSALKRLNSSSSSKCSSISRPLENTLAIPFDTRARVFSRAFPKRDQVLGFLFVVGTFLIFVTRLQRLPVGYNIINFFVKNMLIPMS